MPEGEILARPAPPKKIEKEESEVKANRKISRGPLVIGAIILLSVFAIIGYNLFVPGGASSVVIHDPIKEADGITLTIETASEKAGGEWSGDVDIKIYYDERTEPVFVGSAPVRDDLGTLKIGYDEFVWGNGNYSIMASVNGKEDMHYLTIQSVAEEITISWEDYYADLYTVEPSYRVETTVGYDFGIFETPPGEDPQKYSFQGSLTTPEGDVIRIDSADYPANRLNYPLITEHESKGDYTLTGVATNEFCHPDSPFHEVDIDSTRHIDAPPYAVFWGDISADLEDGLANVTFDGEDSFDDSTISEYKWIIKGEGVDEEINSNEPKLDFSFRKAGTYFVELVVIDDQGNVSVQDPSASSVRVTIE